jgi:hypothetical protein
MPWHERRHGTFCEIVSYFISKTDKVYITAKIFFQAGTVEI